jgi:hypothetical protein
MIGQITRKGQHRIGMKRRESGVIGRKEGTKRREGGEDMLIGWRARRKKVWGGDTYVHDAAGRREGRDEGTCRTHRCWCAGRETRDCEARAAAETDWHGGDGGEWRGVLGLEMGEGRGECRWRRRQGDGKRRRDGHQDGGLWGRLVVDPPGDLRDGGRFEAAGGGAILTAELPSR